MKVTFTNRKLSALVDFFRLLFQVRLDALELIMFHQGVHDYSVAEAENPTVYGQHLPNTASDNFLLLLHGLQRCSLSLAQILVEDKLVRREWRRDIGFIQHQLVEAQCPVGVGRRAAVADPRVQRCCLVSDT